MQSEGLVEFACEAGDPAVSGREFAGNARIPMDFSFESEWNSR